MKKVFKEIFTLKLVLGCYISAIGYGLGYRIPLALGYSTIVTLISCLAVGSVFDAIGNAILSTDYYKESKKNKTIIAVCVYAFYLIAWVITDNIFEYDLDNDFFLCLIIVIAIQIILLIKNLLFSVTEKRHVNKCELNRDDLNNVSGGDEPEEFDWREKGYVTPIKDHTNESGWKFEAYGNVDGQYFKKTGSK